MKQYELWWANLPSPAGRRPVMLLSRTPAYAYLSRVLVVEVTSRVRNIPVEVRLGRHEGQRQTSVANLDNIHVVLKSCLQTRIGALSLSRVPEVKSALGYALPWPELLLPAIE